MSTATDQSVTGRVTQVIGSTFDAEFPEGHLPPIYNALKIESQHKGVELNLVGEVQQHLGGGRVRVIALGSTEGMMRGMEVVDTGKPVSVPVGQATLGRVFNVLGEPIDKRGDVQADDYWPIHRQAPPVNEEAVVETLLPLGSLGDDAATDGGDEANAEYEFLPSASSILEEVVPTSFKVKLFKCFLDSAVSEQVARMVAMKGATESAGDMIKQLSMTYNRARQSQITGEIMEIIGGVEALEG